jgi:hypothetical protein
MSSGRAAILMWAAIASVVAQVAFAEDPDGIPAMAESSSPDAHLATSSGPDGDRVQSENPDDLVVGSDAVDAHLVGSEDPDAMVVGSKSPGQDPGQSTALQDLPNAASQLAADRADFEQALERQRGTSAAEEAAGGSAEEPDARAGPPASVNGQRASIHQAKRKLAEARERSARADSAYGTMMERDYPRGEAREKIAYERKQAHLALDAAEKEYDAALNGGAGPASY